MNESDIRSSKRFKLQPTRRDFLGVAAAWSAVGAFVMAMLGSVRLLVPSVLPEPNSRVKLGKPAQFARGSSTYFQRCRLWVFRDDDGFHAVSSVCTHLGCVAERDAEGQYLCPCHGSKFDDQGNVLSGPAPKGLVWVELSISPEGQLVADTLKPVARGTKLAV